MNSPAVDVKDMLVDKLSLVFKTSISVAREPKTPLDMVTVYDTPGRPTILELDPRPSTMDDSGGEDKNFYRPAVQVRVRNRDYTTGWDLIHDVERILHGRAHETWNSTIYELIQTFGPPAHLTWDENDCAIFVATFSIDRKAA